MSDRWLLLVARPTPAGLDTRALTELADLVAARVPDVVRVGYLDQQQPSIHEVLDDAVTRGAVRVTVLPLAVPPDGYLTQWTARAVANWRETRGPVATEIDQAALDTPALADLVVNLAKADTAPVTASPSAFRSPAWSVLPEHDRHLLVCRGPRCTVYGAGDTHRALAKAARGTGTLVTPMGCVGPCNLGPLVVENPGGHWHQQVDAAEATRLAGAESPDSVC
ncbi:CbiX/SirB N-terminal domain-containing protein [Pseudonocardia spinosispora]|uniref:CbiX/SirB N-terminal domain-containing protein n=1 Tax=Pseudonocardia spinosispora TaxID=103441 RepID=UPI0004017832|nr:(2Fe-2S) ferredoxin domain-containing protein [Pseudonocardia spinosispora]